MYSFEECSASGLLIEAARQACCHDCIMRLPHGYGMMVGTGSSADFYCHCAGGFRLSDAIHTEYVVQEKEVHTSLTDVLETVRNLRAMGLSLENIAQW